MSYWFESDIAVIAVAVILSGFLIPQIVRVAYERQLFDDNGDRKIHNGLVPRLGGLAFFPAALFSLCFVMALNLSVGDITLTSDLGRHGIALLYLACSGILLYVVGMADDVVGVRYDVKFVVQIISALLIAGSGTVIPDLGGLFWIGHLPPIVSWVLTVFLVVFVVNAINLIDGIDGLATGLSIIALVFYAVILYLGECYLYSMLACATIGTLAAFFYFYVFGKVDRRRKVFMGDTGALTVGAILAFLGLAVSALPDTVTTDRINPFVLAYSPLVIPAFDVVRVYLHRVQRHKNPFLPNNIHIHHKLLALGYSQRVVLAIILTCAVFFLASNILLAPYIQVTFILAGDVLVYTLCNILLTRAIKVREDRLGHKLYD